MINPNFQQNFEIPDEAPKMFQMYPEFYLESVLDFVVYTLQSYPQLLLELHLNLPQQLLMFLCATHYFNNPFLAAKVVEVVYSICPEINPPMYNLWESLVNTSLATVKLVPSMIKFYSDLESGTDFYEKFNIRRSMQVIFRSLWKMPIYRSKIIENANQCNEEFVRFVNMVINDATYLLDESLANLKKIHDVENKMANEAEWNAMNDDARQRETDTLSEATRSVRSWLIMGDDTMDMFGYLTKDVPKPFYLDPLGDRVASMLNHNLSELCGPKCTGLKVRDAVKRFHWDPRRLLEQIVDIYLNLASEEFSTCVANDERSYSPETFKIAQARISSVLPISASERFKNLSEAVKSKYDEKQQRDEDYGDDIPDDFLDPLLNTVMLDPVKLPSGHYMDRKNILRHLLTDQTDPFSRLPCTVADLVPDPELQARIQAWIRERRNQAGH
uniref:U-box domain-containing protein n=1 Tax=Panagrolaimus sp. PS1159 TaxID=55785 RepID=A0AC35F793_9BILA